MSEQGPPLWHTEASFLEAEREGVQRQELVLGAAYPVAGATEAHNDIVANLIAVVQPHLRERSEKVHTSAMKVRVGNADGAADAFYYPDIAVFPSAVDPRTEFRGDPKLIVEVASPATRRVDHLEKRLAYAAIPTLEEYVVIEQERTSVVIYRRGDGFEPRHCTAYSGLELESIELHLSFEQIYAGVDFPQE